MEVEAGPVRGSVPVPGDRHAEPRILDEDDLVERHEVGAVHRLGDRQQPGMAVQPEARVHDLQIAEEELDDAVRRPRRRGRLLHLDGMPALIPAGSPERIAQGPGEAERGARQLRSDGRPPASIDRRAGLDRGAGEDPLDVGAQLLELVLADDAFEDVEAAAPVGLEDVPMDPAVGLEPESPAIAELERALLALAHVVAHRPGMPLGGERGRDPRLGHVSGFARPARADGRVGA